MWSNMTIDPAQGSSSTGQHAGCENGMRTDYCDKRRARGSALRSVVGDTGRPGTNADMAQIAAQQLKEAGLDVTAGSPQPQVLTGADRNGISDRMGKPL